MNNTNTAQTDKAPRWAWIVLIAVSLLPLVVAVISSGSAALSKLRTATATEEIAPYPAPDRQCEGGKLSYKLAAKEISGIAEPIGRECYKQITLPVSQSDRERTYWGAYSFYSEDRSKGFWVKFDGGGEWKWFSPNAKNCNIDPQIKRPRWESIPELYGVFQVTTVRVAGEGEIVFREEDLAFLSSDPCR
ncbi:MAG: hypothetical protein AAB897_01225 [Patescibacteria group bacterium]